MLFRSIGKKAITIYNKTVVNIKNVINFLIVIPLILEKSEDINGDKKIVAIQEPPVTIPISVFVSPLDCKKTAIKPLIQHPVNQ